jgi:hypothetical protein
VSRVCVGSLGDYFTRRDIVVGGLISWIDQLWAWLVGHVTSWSKGEEWGGCYGGGGGGGGGVSIAFGKRSFVIVAA